MQKHEAREKVTLSILLESIKSKRWDTGSTSSCLSLRQDCGKGEVDVGLDSWTSALESAAVRVPALGLCIVSQGSEEGCTGIRNHDVRLLNLDSEQR